MDLELGSIVVLACKRIKDLTYMVDELNERLAESNQEYQSIVMQFNDKT